MAAELPNFIVLRATAHQRYVSYYKEEGPQKGWVTAEVEDVFSPLVKIQVEPSKSDERFVHFRFVHTNKYIARSNNSQQLIAVADQPEEDLSKPTCTLFEPVFTPATNALALRHVQSNRRVDVLSLTFNPPLAPRLICLITRFATNELPPSDHYQFIDWDTLIILPRHVAFKGHNDKYLRSLTFQNFPYQQLSADDPNATDTGFEVHTMLDGHVRIKSLHFDRFWRRSPNWIWADNNDANSTHADTLFWPVKIDDNTIALRNAGNNHFIMPLTLEGKTDCLNARVPNMTKETRFVVEELVLKRDIYHVRYRMEESRIYDEEPFLAGTATATNMSNDEATLGITVAYEEASSYSFTSSRSITAGVESKITVGIPKIASGKLRISSEVTQTLEWNETKEEKKTVEVEHSVTVPPKSRATVTYVGTQGKCSVPFSYTQKDKSSTTGQMITSQHADGIFFGVNYYNFQFEAMEIEPL
ncbi:uncharacterized protein LOC131022239 [Salvia miltiorrhiza]|uniref:uncharacterized protein LOC131022239 n=1 Tax=Salvia miltiorrhiza TaxID=226208 RepID=UPI0025AC2888|nr:uncharacterized protein LOC131022239 [Salvia miltiorrhiza]